jgi:hypothetical protein
MEANMENQPWLNRVRERLARQLLPPSYVQRFMEEFSDHLEDLKEEGMEAASSRLGEPEQVADNAVVAYRRRSFLGRHPVAAFLVFAISPVVAWCIVLALLLAAVTPLSNDFDKHPLILSLIFATWSAFLGTFYGELAMRVGIGKKWAVASCTMLGAIATLLGYICGLYTVMVLVQFAVPVAVGWWLINRRYSDRHPATALFVAAVSPCVSHVILTLAGFYALGIISQFVLSGSLKSLSMLFQPLPHLLLAAVPPTVMAAYFSCWLAWRSGIGWKWIMVSCVVVAIFGAKHTLCDAGVPCPAPGMTLIILAQLLVPLAIGWWFLRGKRDQGRLQLAA